MTVMTAQRLGQPQEHYVRTLINIYLWELKTGLRLGVSITVIRRALYIGAAVQVSRTGVFLII